MTTTEIRTPLTGDQMRKLRQRGHAPRERMPSVRSALYISNSAICKACGMGCRAWKHLSRCNRTKMLKGDKRYECPERKLTIDETIFAKEKAKLMRQLKK